MTDFTVIKRDHKGIEKLRYTGRLRKKNTNMVCIEALFGFDDRDLGYVTLRKGDLFTEWFYSNRWYNIFRVEDVNTQQLKGWYCNITRPAEITSTHVAADDLALDLFVAPDGQILLLDEDEFVALDLPVADVQSAWDAVATLKQLVATGSSPFSKNS